MAKALMVWGTSSGAGKSVLCAGLCRWFRRQGCRVAPFKAQNMSNNAAVCADGGEIGRAQALQAQACGLAPAVDMNPVLLKPMAEDRSQVVVLGEARAPASARAYWGDRTALWQLIAGAYDRVAADAELVVLEGAGSPAEPNLMERDLVNLPPVRHADAAALLVTDIDRGGCYAHLLGTWLALPEADRARIKGIIINRFRGDESLLADANDWITERTGVPVLGVIPWLRDLDLPEEDGPQDVWWGPAEREDQVTIGIPELPGIANVSDRDPFRGEPDVSLRRITRAEEVAGCDAVLLLGSRTVPEAAAWLQSSGIGAAIRSHAEAGGSVVGLCGGLQLLGGDIVDDGSGEGAGAGLGLLECTTRFQPAKTTVAGSATWQASDPWQALDTSFPLHGYEIHHGQTTGTEPVLMRAADGRAIAWGREACWGSYLHGTFDDDAFRRWWIDILRQRSGLVPLGSMQHRFDLEPALERFADRLEQHCDMAAIAALVAP